MLNYETKIILHKFCYYSIVKLQGNEEFLSFGDTGQLLFAIVYSTGSCQNFGVSDTGPRFFCQLYFNGAVKKFCYTDRSGLVNQNIRVQNKYPRGNFLK